MHKDVLRTIIETQLRRMKAGERLTQSELLEVSEAQADWILLEFQSQIEEFKQYIKDKDNQIRIRELFIQNHGLKEQFEHFNHRILRRRYRGKPKGA